MKRSILALVFLLSLAVARPALGWSPYEDRDDDWPRPPAWTPEPAPVEPPEGIYLVTETYAGDSISRVGAVTTYSTETVHETTGSYARVLETVGTGGSSAYDGAAFNGRAALTDGRAVAGTYYENYVRTDGGFVPVSVVFFQDDSEIARAAAAARPQPAAPPTPDPLPVLEPAPSQTRTAPPVSIIEDREDRAPAVPVHPAIAPSALLADRSVEVLRGRRTGLSLFGADVRGWRLASGECTALGPLSGSATDQFVARWDRLAPAGSTWVVRFSVDYADGTSHELVVRIAVRAPGLVE